MAIRKFRTGQMSYNAATYVGTAGTIFYDEVAAVLRISDGVTPGGSLINYPVASSTQLGGIKLGPGVVLNGSGQIIIDSEGLDFSFGDLASTTEIYPVGHPDAGDNYAVLSTINPDEDFYLVSNGEGSIDVVGEFNVYKTDGDVEGAISVPPIFTVKGDGQIRMLVPGADSAEGALSIIGGLDGVFQPPVNNGVMLHITGIAGTPGVPSRVYNDAQNAFAAFVARRYNNTAASPSAVLANEEIMRLSGTAHNGTDIPGTANQRIVYVARGNQTLTNQGGAIELWATPLNSTTLAKVATVDSTGIALESGKVLTGNVTGNVSGTAGSAATLTTARNINGVSFNGSADITVTAAAGTLTGNTLASGVTASSLTSVGTLTNLSVTNTITGSISGNAGTATSAATLTTARNINGVSFNGSADITVTAAAGTLTGTTLNATVVTSSLTSVGTLGSLAVTNNITATNYTGLVTHAIRNAGNVTGTTLTLNVTTDDIVKCTFTDAFTVAFSNIIAGRTITLIATNTSAGDTDIITAGISSVNMQGDSTLTVSPQSTAIITYYSLDGDTANIYASAVYG